MRERGAGRTWLRPCARSQRSSAAGSRRMPAGTISNSAVLKSPIDGSSEMTDAPAVHAPPNAETEPCGDLSIRTLAMPADTNQNGDIFGGWLLSQMDIPAGRFASNIYPPLTPPGAPAALKFRQPVSRG